MAWRHPSTPAAGSREVPRAVAICSSTPGRARWAACSAADRASPASGMLASIPPKPIGTSSSGSNFLAMAR